MPLDRDKERDRYRYKDRKRERARNGTSRPALYGRYKNVCLTDTEVSEL